VTITILTCKGKINSWYKTLSDVELAMSVKKKLWKSILNYKQKEENKNNGFIEKYNTTQSSKNIVVKNKTLNLRSTIHI